MRRRYIEATDLESGIVFRFTLDGHQLHIAVRHGKDVQDALAVFFAPDAETVYQVAQRRYESIGASVRLTWFWLDIGRRVQILTCMDIITEPE
jgi:hypothetical protein